MRRGEVWWVSFDPSLGGEIQKWRPAVIVRNEAYVTLNGERRKAMADQLTTVSKIRLQQILGRLSPDDLTGIERAIKVQLGLST